MSTTRSRPPGTTPGDAVGPALLLARMDCLAALSVQVGAVVEEAGRSPRLAADRDWWVRALVGPGRALDDGWDRLAGSPVRRALARPRPWRPMRIGPFGVTRITPIRPSVGAIAVTDRAGPELLADAVDAVLPGRPVRGVDRSRPRRRPCGSGLTGGTVSGAVLPGSVLSGSVLSGSVLSGAAGLWRALPGSGLGSALVLAGALLVLGAVVTARVRAVRIAGARATAERVRSAVVAAADRELVRRSLAVERAHAPAAARAGAGRAA